MAKKYRWIAMDRKTLQQEVPLADFKNWAFPRDIIVEMDKKKGVARIYKIETIQVMV